MADQETPTSARRPWAERLTRNARPAAYVLVLLALGLGGLAIWLYFTYGVPQWPLWAYAGLVATAFLAGGIWLLLFQSDSEGALEAVRLFVLSLGGTIGLFTVLLGGVLGYLWWNDILILTQAGGPDPSLTGNDRKLAILRAVLPLPILIVGMGVAFASLLLARADERSSAFLRRLLYGYNAGVQGLLAILIILVANVFVAMKFSKPIDFTAATFYTLSPTSETLLRSLDKPVKVIVVMDPNDFLQTLIKPMLANCQAATDKLEVEYFSNDPNKDATRVDELKKKYPDLTAGLLVIYGDGGDQYKVIKARDLISEDSQRGPATFEFRGEDALMTEIDFFTTNRKKTIVYFTQSNGELDLKDSQRVSGSGFLKDRLEKKNMEVRPLLFTRTEAEVPKDAELVVIPGPRKTLPEYAVKALDDYMGRKGKLLVLVDPIPAPGGRFQRTGLEEFLGRYGLQLPGEVIFTLDTQDPLSITAEPNPMLEQNPMVSRFQGRQFDLRPARPVRSMAAPPGMSPFLPETVLQADKEQMPWTETDPGVQYGPLVRAMQSDRHLQIRKLKPGQDNPIPLGVTVSESPNMNPHARMMGQPPPTGEQTPRLVVIGSSSMASNGRMADRRGALDFDYLASCVDWLRGKTNSIGIGPKRATVYTPAPAIGSGTFPWAALFLPSLVIFLGVMGVGTGVWLVRRR